MKVVDPVSGNHEAAFRDASEHQPLVGTIQFAAEQVGWLGSLGIVQCVARRRLHNNKTARPGDSNGDAAGARDFPDLVRTRARGRKVDPRSVAGPFRNSPARLIVSELPGRASVSVHYIDVHSPGDAGIKRNVTAVRRPSGTARGVRGPERGDRLAVGAFAIARPDTASSGAVR